MKIHRVTIDRFGLWSDLDLPLNPRGLSVFCGPNEAGKTTLLRFVAGMLYGFPQSDISDGPHGSAFRGGSLIVDSGRETLQITRRRNDRGEVGLSVNIGDRVVPAEDTLQDLLAGTSRSVFQNVFAIGLHELQQLASLQSDDIAERLYGMSLGADGRRLLSCLQQTSEARRALFQPGDGHARLNGLLQRDAGLSSELDGLTSQRDRYDRLLGERQRIADSIAEMKARQAGMQSQLRGHQFLRRIIEPWSQVRAFQNELAALPALEDFPPDGLERLARLRSEILSEQNCHQALRDEIAQLGTRLQELRAGRGVAQHAGAMRRIVKHRESITQLGEVANAVEKQAESLDGELEQQCNALGPEWSRERLAAVDLSPATQAELLKAARGFQAAVVRRGRFRKLYKSADRALAKWKAAVERSGAKPTGETRDDAIQREVDTLQSAENRRRLHQQITELEQRLARISDQPDDPTEVLPKWFRRVLWTFAGAGGAVALLGLVTIFTFNAWAGLVLGLSGLTGLGVARGMQYFWHAHAGTDPDERSRIEAELKTARDKFQQLGSADDSQSPTELLGPAVSRLIQSETDQRAVDRLERARRRMVELRNRLGRVRQQFGQARQDWCDAQTVAGLDVSLKPDDAFTHIAAVSKARSTLDELTTTEQRAQRLRNQHDRWLQRIHDTAQDLGEPCDADADPLECLDEWHQQLDGIQTQREELRQLKRDIRLRRQEAREFARRLKSLRRDRAELLQLGEAEDDDQFEQSAEAWSRRGEIAELLELANEELREAAATEPHLAVVEEDLERFDPEENDRCIEALETEVGDINADLQRTHEELGGVKRGLTEMESDRRASELRFDRKQTESQLVHALTDWHAEHAIAAAVTGLKARYERERQPAVLAKASTVLQRLTAHRYDRVWTPLGQRRLRIDDPHRETWNADDLSGGTREQVFLALRLSLIENILESGVELPILLDDVLVNFDGPRTKAAVEALLELSKSGRQILFLTCHDHIVEEFRSHGVEPTALPARDLPPSHRLAG